MPTPRTPTDSAVRPFPEEDLEKMKAYGDVIRLITKRPELETWADRAARWIEERMDSE